MEAKNFHILEWQRLEGIEFISQFTELAETDPQEIQYRAWVLTDPMIVKNPAYELPNGFFTSWVPLGAKSLAEFLHGTNYDLSRLHDLIIEPQYGFENDEIFVKPVSIGKRVYGYDRKPTIQIWSYYEDTSLVNCLSDRIKLKSGGFQRMF